MINEHAHTLESTSATDPQYWPSENSVKTNIQCLYKYLRLDKKKIILYR